MVGYSVAFFIFQPLNVFIHELGHAFFVKIYGGTIQKIEIGIGEHLFRIGKVQINKQFFIMGLCRYDIDSSNLNKFRLAFIALGGVIFNLMTILLLIAIKLYTDHHHFLDGYFFGFTGVLILSALIPVTYPTGYDSDGRWLINILKDK
ncbi:site-2 protease family protein [Oceanobacillus luteolus]|uniref:Site-2 protease family protein n=1 Tax=Oceanobacillus luteolus TaxID=1274358 RepID=A0ABW4HT30_9BACI